MAKGYYFIALAGIFACMANAQATDSDFPAVTVGGFGTLGASHSTMRLGDYTLDSTLPKGAGRSEDWSAGNDSRIAGHVTAKLTPKVTAVVQVVAEYHTPNTYQPDVEWANVKYAITPDAYLRAGRIALPTFLDSDNRDVGYTYVWIHPPTELYRQLAITSSDGVDAMYRFEIGDVGHKLKAIFYGKNTIERATSKSLSKDMWGIFDTMEYGSTAIHLGYQERLAASQSLLTGVTGTWIRNSDLSIGFVYDPGNWFVTSEWLQRKSTTNITARYASGGYRIEKVTPYLTYSQNSRGSPLPGFPSPASSNYANSVRLANRAQSTASLGVRWDFMKKADFKFQYDQVRLSNDSNGFLANVPDGVNLYGARFNVISAAVDFVF